MMKRSILVVMVLVLASGVWAQVEGTWAGDLEVPGGSLRLVLHLSADADGSWTASLDSPDQGATGIAASGVTWDGSELTAAFAGIGGRYVGRLDEAGAALAGTWHQGGQAFPLRLTRGEGARPRPQTPEPPFPYDAQDVTFRNPEAELTLAGTYTRPHGDGPFPAVVLVSGSGPQDRDETLFGHKPFLVLADHLTRAGVAVLRYDDRGVGGSEAGSPDATTEDLAGDAAAAVAWLRARPEVDPARTGLVGHSEGGLIGPLVAAADKDLAFLVLLAGPAVSGRDILLAQARFMLEREPMAAGSVDRVLPWLEKLYDAPADQVNVVLKEARADLGETMAEMAGIGASTHAQVLQQLIRPWTRWFLAYDPAPALAALDIPVLALFGAKDFQVPPDLNADPMRKALAAGSPPNEVVVLPDLNHLFQTAETGALLEYAQIVETFAPTALKTITAWILNL